MKKLSEDMQNQRPVGRRLLSLQQLDYVSNFTVKVHDLLKTLTKEGQNVTFSSLRRLSF
jgi:hypothetical protein